MLLFLLLLLLLLSSVRRPEAHNASVDSMLDQKKKKAPAEASAVIEKKVIKKTARFAELLVMKKTVRFAIQEALCLISLSSWSLINQATNKRLQYTESYLLAIPLSFDILTVIGGILPV
jgi:hypothetical protein